jgi:hypothetical protein
MVGRAWFVLLAIRLSRLSRTLTHRHPEHKRHQRQEAAGTEAVRSDKDIVNLYKGGGLRRLTSAFRNPLRCMFNGIYYSIDIQ